MKRIHLASLRAATAVSLAAVAAVWSDGQIDTPLQAPAAPSGLTLAAAASNAAAEAINPFVFTAAAGWDVNSARWTDIKDNPFEARDLFLVGLVRLQARVDLQIAELAAKRAAMIAENTETKSWDFAMKEMENSRSYLLSMGDEAAMATRENWDPMKQKVGYAWLRTQEAYGKVKASTTQ